MIKYELWETDTGPILFPSYDNNTRKALKEEPKQVCLMVFTARSWDDACRTRDNFLSTVCEDVCK